MPLGVLRNESAFENASPCGPRWEEILKDDNEALELRGSQAVSICLMIVNNWVLSEPFKGATINQKRLSRAG
jgi:hypothetical protein